MKNSVGKLFLFGGLICIAFGVYIGFIKDKADDNKEQKEVEDSITIGTKKKAYLSAGSVFINEVAIKVFNQDLDDGLKLNSSDFAYYVPVSNDSSKSCVQLDKGGKSPFGEWEYAYVIVTLDDSGKRYYYSFMALDKAGYGFLPTMEETDDWNINNVGKEIIPIIPNNYEVVDGDVFSLGTSKKRRALILSGTDKKCIIPDKLLD